MGIIAVAANLVFFGLLLGVEALISWRKWIPERQANHDPEYPLDSFLYLRDRDMFRIGDTVGLSILAFAIGSMVDLNGLPPFWYVVGASLFGAVYTIKMHYKVWLPQQKRDSGYPPGGVSLMGIVHLPYHAGHFAWALVGLWHIMNLWRAPDPSILGLSILGILGWFTWRVAVFSDGRKKRHL